MLFFHLHLQNPFSIEAKLFKTTKKAKEIILKKQPFNSEDFSMFSGKATEKVK